jgi:hypothetical protein
MPAGPTEVHLSHHRFASLTTTVLTLALATACTGGADLPTSVASGGAARTLAPANAPTGTHFQAGTSATCDPTSTGFTCSSYVLAGVGNADASATLTAQYSATVNCTNRGGNLVPVKSQASGASATTGKIEAKNGKLVVPALSTGAVPSDAAFTKDAVCPNGNWTKTVQSGSIALVSYAYTLTFVGCSGPYITVP